MNLLAFDLGAESGRAVLGRLSGERLRVAEVHRFDNAPVRAGAHLHWDLEALWANVKTGLARAAERTKALHGVGVDTWGVDYGLVARDGRVIGRPFHYRDARTDGVMENVLARLGRERVYGSTGVQFLPFNTLFQLIAHARDNPAELEAAHQLLFMPDLLRFKLSGEAHTEPTIASTSQMYDPRGRAWSAGLLDELGVPARLLPPIEPTGRAANMLQDLWRASGLRCSCPVVAGPGHDTAAAVAAVPAEGKNWCYISSGTWSLMGVELDRPIVNAGALRHNFTNEAGLGRSVRFLRNIMGLWLVQECRRDFARRSGGADRTYEQLTELAAEASGCEALVDPNHASFLAPGDVCAKIECFCRETNQSPPVDDGQVIRCCLESLALAYRATLEQLQELTGRRIDTIHIVGGGSKNELLNQMTADACGRAVVAGPVEATAIGNVLAQASVLGGLRGPRAGAGAGAALKHHGPEAIAQMRRIVANSFEVKRFEPADPAPWRAKYQRFREVIGR